MNTYYENSDLIRLADKVKDFYNNPEIVNYVHNGKKIPVKYERMLERSLMCSNIQGEKSLYVILSNAIKYSFLQSIQLNNTTELRMYRETSERCKLLLASYKRKYELGDKSIISEIEKKEEEIKMIQTKIDEIATQTSLKPEINKNILNTAEESYLLLLRSDKTPYYFYLEICKKLGKRVNLDQLFPGFRDINNKNNNKKFKKENKDDSDDEDYRNYLEMNVKKSSYVAPAFRKDNLQDKLSRVDNIIKKEEEEENKIIIKKEEKAKTKEELFPSLNSEVKTQSQSQSQSQSQLGAWGKKLVIETVEQPIKQDISKQDILKQDISKQDIAKQDVAKQDVAKQDVAKQDISNEANNEWGESTWENMEDY
jgi:hypothetical protein